MSGGNVAIKRRKELRKELALIEKQIFDLETTYLEETKEVGNIFTGWGAYLAPDKVPKKKAISSDERLFSLSSTTSPAIRPKDSAGDEGGGGKKKRKV
jgi:chromatin modification-related protein EAF6